MNRISVDVREIEPLPWVDKLEVYAQSVLASLGRDCWEISIVFCSDSFIRELNRVYRNKDEATDVLSFEMGQTIVEDSVSLYIAGDIVISLAALERNVRDFNVDSDEELKRLLIHGILHLSGMDHVTNNEDETMLLLQEKLLTSLQGERIL